MAFLTAAVLLHATALLLATMASPPAKSPAGGRSVRVNLVSGGGGASTAAAHSAPSDAVASQLENLTKALAAAAPSSALQARSAQGFQHELLPGPTAPPSGSAAGASDGAGRSSAGAGVGTQDPYARASLTGDTGPAAMARSLREQIMACWLGPPQRQGIDVEIVLTPEGTLQRAPRAMQAAVKGRDDVALRMALAAVADCAPYHLSGHPAGSVVVTLG